MTQSASLEEALQQAGNWARAALRKCGDREVVDEHIAADLTWEEDEMAAEREQGR